MQFTEYSNFQSIKVGDKDRHYGVKFLFLVWASLIFPTFLFLIVCVVRYFNLIVGWKKFLQLMHLNKLADSRSSAAYRAWHTGEGCLNDCFYFAMQRFLQSFECFCIFWKKNYFLIWQKDFKQEHTFVQNLNTTNSKGSKKIKGMFVTYELYFKSSFESFLNFVFLQCSIVLLYCICFFKVLPLYN